MKGQQNEDLERERTRASEKKKVHKYILWHYLPIIVLAAVVIFTGIEIREESTPSVVIKEGRNLNVLHRGDGQPISKVHPGETVFVIRDLDVLRDERSIIDSWFEKPDATIQRRAPIDFDRWFSEGVVGDRTDREGVIGHRRVTAFANNNAGKGFVRSFAITIPSNLQPGDSYVFRVRRRTIGFLRDYEQNFPPVEFVVADK